MRPNKMLPGIGIECLEGLPIPRRRTNGTLELLPDAGEIWSWHFRREVAFVRSSDDRDFSLRLQSATSKRNASSLHIRADKLHDVIHRRARLEDGGYAKFLESINILIGNDPANQYQNIIHFVLFE